MNSSNCWKHATLLHRSMDGHRYVWFNGLMTKAGNLYGPWPEVADGTTRCQKLRLRRTTWTRCIVVFANVLVPSKSANTVGCFATLRAVIAFRWAGERLPFVCFALLLYHRAQLTITLCLLTMMTTRLPLLRSEIMRLRKTHHHSSGHIFHHHRQDRLTMACQQVRILLATIRGES